MVRDIVWVIVLAFPVVGVALWRRHQDRMSDEDAEPSELDEDLSTWAFLFSRLFGLSLLVLAVLFVVFVLIVLFIGSGS